MLTAFVATEAEGKVNLPDTKNPYFRVIAKLYENLELEAALSTLQQARNWPGNGAQEYTWLELMDGVFQAGAGNEAASVIAFKRALMFDATAQLPVPVSPSLLKLLNRARKDVGLPLILPQPDSTPPPALEVTRPPPVAPPPAVHAHESTTVEPAPMAPVVLKLPPWVPWAVLGAGATLTLGSSIMYFQARDAYRAFAAEIIACGGCVPEPEMVRLRSRGDILKWAAYGGYALGGAAVVGGAVLVYLNHPQSSHTAPGEHDRVVVAPVRTGVTEMAGEGPVHLHARGPNADPQPSIVPWLGPGSGGALLTVYF